MRKLDILIFTVIQLDTETVGKSNFYIFMNY